MNKTLDNREPPEGPIEGRHGELVKVALQRNWGLSFMLAGWLHLLAFSFCYYLTLIENYHAATGYLLIWIGELIGMWLIFRICGGARSPATPPAPLETFIRRVWLGYFVLAFDLGSLNNLRGHELFEFFPAIAALASFGFMMMSIVIHWKFFGAVLVMFASGLLMAAFFVHAYLVFGLAWWLVLGGISVGLWLERRQNKRKSSDRKDGKRAASIPAIMN
jgi:hypothetical protein